MCALQVKIAAVLPVPQAPSNMIIYFMTPNEILNLNGDFKQSPLLDTLHRLDSLFTKSDISYAVVGGLAVIRNGAHRTTMDIDILIRSDDWNALRANPPEFLEVDLDSAKDLMNQVDIDILFPGNEWDMEIELPNPEKINERDTDLNGMFAALIPLLIIKCAVYRKKLKEDGIEIAAKDLYDLSELLKIRGAELTAADYSTMPESIASTLKDIYLKVKPKL